MDCATTHTLAKADPIPIAQLSSTIEDEKQRYIRGAVVLLWPYSSSTKQFQILLSEPDFRLRSSRGQVRVTFRGASAEAVAKSQIGIGDTVLLGLDGVSWEGKADEEQAVAGELDLGLVFVDRVVLQIFQGSNSLGIIDLDATPQGEDEARNSPLTTNPPRTPPSPSPYSQQSPGISQIIDSPFRLNDSSIFGYNEEDDGYISGKGRKRTKWGRPSSEWVFVDSPPSPIRETGSWDTDEFDVDVDVRKEPETAEQFNAQFRSPTPTRTAPEIDARMNVDQSSDSGSPAVEMEKELGFMTSGAGHQEWTSPEQIDAQASSPIQVPEDFAVRVPMTVSEAPEPGFQAENRENGLPIEMDHKQTLDGVFREQASDRSAPSPTASSGVSDTVSSGAGMLEQKGEEQTQVRGDELVHGFEPSSSMPRQASVSTQSFETADESGYLDTDARSTTSSRIKSNFRDQFIEAEAPEAVPLEGKNTSDNWRLYEDRVDRFKENGAEAGEEAGDGLTREASELGANYDAENGMDGHIETAVEKHMSDRPVQEEYRSDLEGDTDDYASSIVDDEDTQQPVTQVLSQTEVIVIDSDDESQIGDVPETAENLSPEQETFSPMRGDEGLINLPTEPFQHEKSKRGSPGADAIFDERMVDVNRQENLGGVQVERKSSTQTTHIWLDGCMEYEVGQKHPGGERNHKTPTTFPFDTSNHGGLLPEAPAINSWSIPVRTVSDNHQRPGWRRTLHTESQMITPDGTQETVNSQPQELSSPLITTPNPPTPQFSQRTRSIISTDETSEAERSFDGSDGESVEKSRTRVTPKAPEKSISPPTHSTSTEVLNPSATGALLQEIEREPKLLNLETPSSEERVTESVESPFAASVWTQESRKEPEIATFRTPRSESGITEREQSPTGIPSEPRQDMQPQREQVAQQLSWPIAGIRTRLAYFCPFSLLSENFNSAVDTMSIVASATPVLRGTRKPRDYFTILQLMDPSTAGTTVCVQIFRKNKEVLPVTSKGDVILLRNFKVRSMDHKFMLCTMGHSSWAVFVQGDEENVQINGPPVEYGVEERACVTELRQWYAEEGAELVEKNESLVPTRGSTETSVTGGSETGSVSSARNAKSIFRKYQRSRNSTGRRRLTVHHLRHGRRYTDVSPSESIHKLRDGKLYAHI